MDQAQYNQANASTTLSDLGNAIPKTYYSTNPLLVTQSQYNFFQKLPTEVDGSDTNMLAPGQFTEGTKFLGFFVGFSITPPRAAAPTGITTTAYQQLMNWAEVSTLTLKINNIEWFQSPLIAFMGNLNFGMNPTVAGDGVAVTGNGNPTRWMPLKSLKSNYIPFESKVQFTWVVNTWDLTLTAVTINNYRMKLMMNGVYQYQK